MIASYLRHFLTFLAGIGGILASCNLIGPDDIAAANAAGPQLIEPLLILAGLLAVAAARWILSFFGGKTAVGIGKGGLFAPLVWIGMTAGIMGSLPSCSPAQRDALKSVPIKSCVLTDYGTACYSTQDGVSVVVDAQSGK